MENTSLDTAALPKNGHSKTIQLSSNATLFWRVFMPVFGTVFITGLLLVFFLTDPDDLYLSYPIWIARIVLIILSLGWIWFIRRTLWRLKRVDANDTHFFVTNYWQTVRYPWQDLSSFEEKTKLGRRVVNFKLHQSGRFGQKISFLPGSAFEEWKKVKRDTTTSGF
jgi:hypothetical protein